MSDTRIPKQSIAAQINFGGKYKKEPTSEKDKKKKEGIMKYFKDIFSDKD